MTTSRRLGDGEEDSNAGDGMMQGFGGEGRDCGWGWRLGFLPSMAPRESRVSRRGGNQETLLPRLDEDGGMERRVHPSSSEWIHLVLGKAEQVACVLGRKLDRGSRKDRQGQTLVILLHY